MLSSARRRSSVSHICETEPISGELELDVAETVAGSQITEAFFEVGGQYRRNV